MKKMEILTKNQVNLDQALEIWGNDIAMYDENLSDYRDSLVQKSQELEMYKQNHDCGNYGILVHSLKSESKYFGFMKEAELFLEHELKGKEMNDEFIQTNFASLKEQIMKTIEVINQYLSSESGAKKTILAVDDSQIVLKFIENFLQNEYHVIKATNGALALQHLANEEIYAIFLDLNMPESNGFEVLNYLERYNLIKKIPVVIITGDDTKETIEKAFSYPILEVLNKPFNEENITRVLASIENFYQEKNISA